MNIKINDISEPVIDGVKCKVFFTVTYTKKHLFLRKGHKVNCCAVILTHVKSLVDYYDMDNWQQMNQTLGYEKSKGVEIFVESFFKENYKTLRQ